MNTTGSKRKSIKFITSNSGKLREVQLALEPIGFTVEQLDVSYPEVQASSLEEVVKFGINWVSTGLVSILRETDWSVIIEDSGLFVHALKNFPGVYSKPVFKTLGCDGILKLLADARDPKERTAHFISCIGYAEPGGTEKVFVGKCTGTISSVPKGAGGFGFDPIFIPDGEARTFAELAELDLRLKNNISHRGKALAQLSDFLTS